MEGNITKILIKRFWKRCVIFPWTANKGVRASPFGALCIKDILIYLIALSDLNVCFPGVIIGIYQTFLIHFISDGKDEMFI